MMASGGSRASVDWRGFTAATTDASSYTFSSASIGAAYPDRHVALIVGAASSQNNYTRVVSSVTIGGVSATIIEQVRSTQHNYPGIGALVIAAVPEGTSADIVVTFSGTVLRCAVGRWVLRGLASPTPRDTHSELVYNMSTATVDAPKGGVLIGGLVGEYGGEVTEGLSARASGAFDTYGDYNFKDHSFDAPETGYNVRIAGTSGYTGVALFSVWD